METNFKVGDRVYDIVWGWGVVKSDMGINNIEIRFDSKIYQVFRKDGRYTNSSEPTLSFTEYTLQGFNQERPIILPEVGELCLVRDIDIGDWHAVKFKECDKNRMPHQFIDSTNAGWGQMKRIKILD